MTIPASCDVAVIGGGPGGAMAAIYLRQAGYDVVVLERQRHPRYAIGESLIPDFWRYCDAAGVSDRILAEGFVQKAGGVVDWNGETRHISFKQFGYTRPALHVERERFDAILIDHARSLGAQVFEEVTVTDVELGGEGEGAQVACRPKGGDLAVFLNCRYVVDASGQNAVIGRQLGLRSIDEAFRFMSLWGYFRDSDYLDSEGQTHPATRVTEVPPTTYVTNLPDLGDWGWSWHIPLREKTSVGLIVPIEVAKAARREEGEWEKFFLEQCERLPTLRRLLSAGSFIPDSLGMVRNYSYRSTQVAGPGWFLIGDAAGFIDPIFSVGVLLSMYSAFAAAWAIDGCLKEPERAAEMRAIYTDQIFGRMELGRSLALPGYARNAEASRQAREVVKLTSSQSQALMQAASLVTARPHNFESLMS